VSNTGVSSGYRIEHRKSHGGINGALAFSSSVAQAAAPFIAALI
jgi:hypothetical protein